MSKQQSLQSERYPKGWSSLAARIERHWKENFPKEAAALEQAGKLREYAVKAQDRAALAHEQARENGLSWSQAEELAVQEWGMPPTLS